jgi:hypothetical protein
MVGAPVFSSTCDNDEKRIREENGWLKYCKDFEGVFEKALAVIDVRHIYLSGADIENVRSAVTVAAFA